MEFPKLTEQQAQEALARFQAVQKQYQPDDPRWVAASRAIHAICAHMAEQNKVSK